MPVSYDYYRVFYEVASRENMTAAAHALFLSQPTVSKAIGNLEQMLDCPLFVRSKNGVSLTPEGELLYGHVARAITQLQKAEEALSSRRALTEGSVRIGASEMTLRNYLIPLLEEFRRRHPFIQLRIAGRSTPGAVAALREGLVDFAVVISPVDGEGLIVRTLQSFQDIFVAGPRYAALAERVFTMAELVSLPECNLICTDPDTTSRRYLQQLFSDRGLVLKPDIELSTTDLVVPMVAHNLGVGFVPEQFAREQLSAGEIVLLRLSDPPPSRQICLVQDPAQSLSLAGRAFLELLNPDGQDPKESD